VKLQKSKSIICIFDRTIKHDFMGISDLYLSIGQRRNISHFANIVRIAKSDNNISTEEIEFLAKISKKYNISNEQFRDILKFPENIPTIAHLDCIERIERLYDLLVMVKADQHVEQQEVLMLRRIVTGLAFPLNRVDMIVDHSLEIDVSEVDVDIFTDKILKLLKMR
jgi:uncharacterized tellurite resistance protein B-like protein